MKFVFIMTKLEAVPTQLPGSVYSGTASTGAEKYQVLHCGSAAMDPAVPWRTNFPHF